MPSCRKHLKWAKAYKTMDFLPKDPAILVSSVNMLLRDEEFDTLESLCYAFKSEQQKQFRPIGYDQ